MRAIICFYHFHLKSNSNYSKIQNEPGKTNNMLQCRSFNTNLAWEHVKINKQMYKLPPHVLINPIKVHNNAFVNANLHLRMKIKAFYGATCNGTGVFMFVCLHIFLWLVCVYFSDCKFVKSFKFVCKFIKEVIQYYFVHELYMHRPTIIFISNYKTQRFICVRN